MNLRSQSGLSSVLLASIAALVLLMFISLFKMKNDQRNKEAITQIRQDELRAVKRLVENLFLNKDICNLNLGQLNPKVATAPIELNQIFFIPGDLTNGILNADQNFPGTQIKFKKILVENEVYNFAGETGEVRLKVILQYKDVSIEKDKKLIGGETSSLDISVNARLCDYYPFRVEDVSLTRGDAIARFNTGCGVVDTALTFVPSSLVIDPSTNGQWIGYCKGACAVNKPIIECL